MRKAQAPSNDSEKNRQWFSRARATSLCLFSLFVMACTTGPCRELRDQKAADAQGAGVKPGTAVEGGVMKDDRGGPQVETVFVFKPDGSLQCGERVGIAVQSMEQELRGIQVFSRNNRPDGMMRIQVCGAPTGQINVYEIPATSLSEAEKRGFKKLEV